MSSPLLTTKKVAWKTCLRELLWFIKGQTDNEILQQQKVNIWNGNASREYLDSIGLKNREEDDLGPVYGHQWRHFDGIDGDNKNKVDQIKWLIDEISTNPNSRRLIVSAWNPNQISEMALPPCHTMAQFRVLNGKLSCQLYQRSADMFLGVPFNIASYSLLTHMIARECNLQVGHFIHSLGDFHIYEEHFDQVKIQLQREPKKLPSLEFKQKKLSEYKTSDFKLINYEYHPKIEALMNV